MMHPPKISDTKNINREELFDQFNLCDVFIYYSNGTERSTFSLKEYEECFPEGIEIAAFEEKVSDSSLLNTIRSLLDNNLDITKNIIVDVSCMPRETIASTFVALDTLSECFTISATIIYSHAVYTEPAESMSPNDSVKPVHLKFSGWFAKPKLSTTAITGLGYEKDKAIGAIEYIETNNLFLFVPNSLELRYKGSIEKQNEALLSTVPDNQIIQYDLENPVSIIYSLNSMVQKAKESSKVAFLPFGPKIFFAASILVALRNPEVVVWHVSGDSEDINKYDQKVANIFGFRFSINKNLLVDSTLCI